MMPRTLFASSKPYSIPNLMVTSLVLAMGTPSFGSGTVAAVDYSLTSSYNSVLDEYANPYYKFGIASGLILQEVPNWRLGLDTAITQPDSIYVNDPTKHGLEDLTLSATGSENWLTEKNYGLLTPAMTLTLPLSQRSRDVSLNFSTSAVLKWSRPLNPYLSIGSSAGVIASHYRYETGNAFGTIKNSPFAYIYGVSATVQPTSSITGVLSYGRHHRVDYDALWSRYQTFRAIANAVVTKGFSVYGGYLWSDRDLTNDPILYLGKTRFELGLTIDF